MKTSNHYTEEDLQSFLDNSFTGDKAALEVHLQDCGQCRRILNAYSMVCSFAKTDMNAGSLKIDLARTVASRAFATKERRPVFEKAMYALFILLGAVSLYFCFNYLFDQSMPPSFILLIIPFAGYLWLNYKEVKMVERRFATEVEF